jgi:alpha/beta superfamily hydrolase
MQTAVEIKSRDQILRGTLHTPVKLNAKVPVVIIYHGFGGNKTGPHFLFTRFSRILEEQGIASVRVDFAGSGESDGDFVNMTLSGELEDAVNILEFVKSLEFIDPQKILVVGFSMGGAVASLLAGIHGSDIRALCLWAPAGNMAEIVRNDFIGSEYEVFMQKGYYEFEGLLIGKNFVEDIDRIDIYSTASAYPGKVLLLHGDEDEVVSLNASKEYLKYYDNKAELIVIAGADHLFNRQDWIQAVLRHTEEFFFNE